MKKFKEIMFNYIIPIALVSIIFIPFICLFGSIGHIYLSPITAIINWEPSSIAVVIYVLFNIAYLVLVYVKQNKTVGQARRVMLFTSVILYFVIFKLTSNINLNLLSAVLNTLVIIIYIANFIRDYMIKPVED